MPTVTSPIQHGTESPSQSNQVRKRKKSGKVIGKKEGKFSLFTDNMIVYTGNSRLNQKPLDLLNKFSKVAGHIINIQKSGMFLYTSNKISEKN